MILKGIHYPKTRTTKGYFKSYSDPYYQTREWKKLRAYKFSINPLCEDCEDQGKIVAGHTVDHVIPRKKGGSDEITNLRTRCKRCNAIKTALDQ